MPRSIRLRISLLAALAVAALGAYFVASSVANGPHVTIAGSSIATYHFKPHKLTIHKGKTVHWSWSSNAPHNVTFRKLGKHSKTGRSESFKLRFKKPGTYSYLCTVHGFRGKIVVKR
jgi:plastocyanin